jgi:hypothetical protein
MLYRTNWFQCYDSTNQMFGNFSLKDVIDDMSIVLMEDIPDDILGQLTEADISSIASRPSKDDDDIKSEIMMLSTFGGTPYDWMLY